MKSFSLSGALLALSLIMTSSAYAGQSGTKPPKSAMTIDAVKTISISTDVALPDDLHYLSAGKVWGSALGGAVGGAIVAANSPQQSIKAQIEDGQTDIGSILVEEMRLALSRQTRFQVVDKDADVVLHLQVLEYGFHASNPFTSNMKVLLKAQAELDDPQEAQVFRQNAAAWNTAETRHTMDDFLADRALLRAAFHDVAANVAVKQVNVLLKTAKVTTLLSEKKETDDSKVETPNAPAPTSAAPAPVAPASDSVTGTPNAALVPAIPGDTSAAH